MQKISPGKITIPGYIKVHGQRPGDTSKSSPSEKFMRNFYNCLNFDMCLNGWDCEGVWGGGAKIKILILTFFL